MANDIVEYVSTEFRFRTVKHDGQTWFVGEDIVRCIDEIWRNDGACLAHVPEEYKAFLLVPELRRKILCLSRPGVSFYLMRSPKQKAVPFQKHLASVVMESIYDTGSYSVPAVSKKERALSRQERVLQILKASQELIVEQEEIIKQQDATIKDQSEAIAFLEPKAAALEEMAKADGDSGLREAAKQLNVPPVWFANKFLTERLGWLYVDARSGRRVPKQSAINNGWARLGTFSQISTNGNSVARPVVLITPGGLVKLRLELDRLRSSGLIPRDC